MKEKDISAKEGISQILFEVVFMAGNWLFMMGTGVGMMLLIVAARNQGATFMSYLLILALVVGELTHLWAFVEGIDRISPVSDDKPSDTGEK